MAQAPMIMPSIPVSDGSTEGNYASIDAIKQNIEIGHGYQGLANSAKPRNRPTTVNTATGAALRRVQGTYP